MLNRSRLLSRYGPSCAIVRRGLDPDTARSAVAADQKLRDFVERHGVREACGICRPIACVDSFVVAPHIRRER